jgi:hypothetical protein
MNDLVNRNVDLGPSASQHEIVPTLLGGLTPSDSMGTKKRWSWKRSIHDGWNWVQHSKFQS